MRAFIIRPFGTKNDINFDKVEEVLIGPALKRVGAEGGTTIDIVEAGNIRVDMFRRLLTADLVVADLSVHNANVFYELGIRHALRDRSTLMLRCDMDKFPFDLQTDRYFLYPKEDPAASLEELVAALQSTINSSHEDSPVFMSLPELTEPDPSHFMVVPLHFGEEVTRAVNENHPGDLALLSNEVTGFEWEVKGWRTVGREQFRLKAFADAKVTWEAVREIEPDDLEANLLLGTVYQRLGDLTRSTQALDRGIANKRIKKDERAEVYALLARNAKSRWRDEWKDEPIESRKAKALRSPHLKDTFENYLRAFDEDLNHFYSGLNALATLSVMIELAANHPEVWSEQFDSDEEAAEAINTHKEQATKLAAAVEISLAAAQSQLEREKKTDIWVDSSAADLRFLISKRPLRVAAAYRDALKDATSFVRDAVRNQLSLYEELDVLTSNLAEVMRVVGDAAAQPEPQQRKRVLLFAGHMIDAPGRDPERFPARKEPDARKAIKAKVSEEMNKSGGVACGYSGGANGSDTLFLEVCAELSIPTRLYLAFPPQLYVTTSVSKAGSDWVDRFWQQYNLHAQRKQVRVLSEVTSKQDDEKQYLPPWLRAKQKYGIWQRNNLWMLFNALSEAQDQKSGYPNLTLIALWDGQGQGADGPGGTGDLVQRVQDLGASVAIIKTRDVFEL